MFGGIIETFEVSSDGMVTLVFNEIQSYLDSRMIRSDLVFSTIDQNVIAALLVDYATSHNITGGSVDPVTGPAIQLVGIISGPLTNACDQTDVVNNRLFQCEAKQVLLK